MTPHPQYDVADFAAFDIQWIDPVAEDTGRATFHLYEQPSRPAVDGQTQGSYFLYLPPGYDEDAGQRFPVLYWLHGGTAHSHQAIDVIDRIDGAIRSGTMPPTIVVAPQALPVGWYVDSKDGARPVEQVMLRDLVPHIDATYKTVAESNGRSVEGFSMGGFGALHLAFKRPDLFSRATAIAPSILRDLSMEPELRIANTFFGDQEYFDAVGPWALALANGPEIRQHVKIRVLAGGLDSRLITVNRELGGRLDALGISHETFVVDGADHEHDLIIDGIGDAYYAFYRS